MSDSIDMLSEEWMDEFERNWGLLRADLSNDLIETTASSSSIDTDSQHKSSTATTGLDQTSVQA